MKKTLNVDKHIIPCSEEGCDQTTRVLTNEEDLLPCGSIKNAPVKCRQCARKAGDASSRNISGYKNRKYTGKAVKDLLDIDPDVIGVQIYTGVQAKIIGAGYKSPIQLQQEEKLLHKPKKGGSCG